MIEITRGTTPTFEFETETRLSLLDEIYIVLRQETGNGHIKVEKTLTKDCVKTDENHFFVKLSQEETLHLTEGVKVELQLKAKAKSGDVMTTEIATLNVRRALKEEVV